MKNLNLSYFLINGEVHKYSVCNDMLQYTFMNKSFIHYQHGVRMINNVELDKDKFIQRVIEKLSDAVVPGSITSRYIYDSQMETNVFLFKVDVYGYILFTCDSDKQLNDLVNYPDLRSELSTVFDKFEKVMV